MRLALIVMFALTTVGTAPAAEPHKHQIELNSELTGVLGLPMTESTRPVYHIRLAAMVDEKGEGDGTLVLDPTGLPAYDEFGFPGASTAIPIVKLDCRCRIHSTS